MAAKRAKPSSKRRVADSKRRAPVNPVEELVDEDGEPEVDGDFARVTFNPLTHQVVSAEYLASLVETRRAESDSEARRIAAEAKHAEIVFSAGERTSAALMDELVRANARRDEAFAKQDSLRDELAEKDRKLAEMIRTNEDARLERERLQATLQERELALRHLEAQNDHKLAVRKADLEVLGRFAGPAFGMMAQSVSGLLAEVFDPAKPNGAKVASAQRAAGGGAMPPGPPVTAPEGAISTDHIEEWASLLQEILSRLSLKTMCVLRALLSSQTPGVPACPYSFRDVLAMVLQDVGADPVKQLFVLTSMAYRIEAPAANDPAPNVAPPSGAPN